MRIIFAFFISVVLCACDSESIEPRNLITDISDRLLTDTPHKYNNPHWWAIEDHGSTEECELVLDHEYSNQLLGYVRYRFSETSNPRNDSTEFNISYHGVVGEDCDNKNGVNYVISEIVQYTYILNKSGYMCSANVWYKRDVLTVKDADASFPRREKNCT